MKSLIKTFGALAAGLVLASGCRQRPVLTGEFEGKKYTLNFGLGLTKDSIVEEKIDAGEKIRTEIYLIGLDNSPKTIEFEDYCPQEGFCSKKYSLQPEVGGVTVSNSQGIVTYKVSNRENWDIIARTYANLWRGINGVASNKTVRIQQRREKTLSKIVGDAQ